MSAKLKKCELCGSEATLSAVIDGTYYRNICEPCKNSERRISGGHARWKRSIDAEDHAADTVQPFKADGTPNPVFARLYPDKAKELFGDADLRKASL